MAKFSISLPDPLTDQLDQQVTLQHCGRSKVIQDALSAYLEAGAGKSKPRAAAAPAAEKAAAPEEHPLHKTVQAHQTHLDELTAHLDSMRTAMAEMIKNSGTTLSDTLARVLGRPEPSSAKAEAAAPVKAAPAKRGPKPGAKAAARAAAAALLAKKPAAKVEEAPKVRAKPGPKPGARAKSAAPKAAPVKELVAVQAAAPKAEAAPPASRWQVKPKK